MTNALFDSWLDDQQPFDDVTSHRQISALRDLCGDRQRRILDLGCGAGRTLIPLVEDGHDVIGVDNNGAAIKVARNAMTSKNLSARLLQQDFSTLSASPFDEACDVILLLGNTLMTLWNVDDAVAFMTNVQSMLTQDGQFVIDDIPGEYWSQVTEGNWLNGISDDGDMQMVWALDDAVFALRTGDQIDARRDVPDASDMCYRLWTHGSLALAAGRSGLSPPAIVDGGNLLVMRPT